MSWEAQGRQYHSWFGHGTAGGVADAGGRAAGGDVVGVVASGALARLMGERRAEFSRYLSRDGLAELGVLLPVWAGHSDLGGAAFRREVVGGALSADAADAANRVGRAYGAGDLAAAGEALARVVVEGGPAWRYGVRWAQDLAISKNLLADLPKGPQQSEPFLIADNQRENKAFRDVVVILNLDKDQAQRLHREISGQGFDFHMILEIGKDLFQ